MFLGQLPFEIQEVFAFSPPSSPTQVTCLFAGGLAISREVQEPILHALRMGSGRGVYDAVETRNVDQISQLQERHEHR